MDDPPTVLFVDDQPALADGYAATLEDHGYGTMVAYGGRAALDRLDETVDVVCLDRRMPGLSGEETLEAIREAGYDCRVVMLTGVEPNEAVPDMPFDDYLVKPIDSDDLRETIHRLTLDRTDAIDAPVLDALGDAKARRCCAALVGESRSAQEIAEVTDLSLPTIYRRLNTLQQAGLVESRTVTDPNGNHYQTFATVDTRIEVEVGDGVQLRVDRADRSPA
jgi:DNA-binding response OmpR family regulator